MNLNSFYLLIAVVFLCSCSDSSESQSDSGGDDVQTASDSPLTTAAKFDKEMSKAGCELLSPALVSATFDVPAEALRQMKIMGCRYSWESDTETLEGGISMIRVYKSGAAAAQWFAKATKNKTAEEMQAEMEEISRRLEQSEELETNLQKSVAKSMLASVGSKAVNFEDVADVGDEARINEEGTVYVHVGNMTFMVSAYKGAKAPPVELQGVDMKQWGKVAQEHAAQWTIETASQRKRDGTLLAKAIVDEL